MEVKIDTDKPLNIKLEIDQKIPIKDEMEENKILKDETIESEVTSVNSEDIEVPNPFLTKPYECRIRIQKSVRNTYSFTCNRCTFTSTRVNNVNRHLYEHAKNLSPIDINNNDNKKIKNNVITYEFLNSNEKLLCPFCLFSTKRINVLIKHKKYCKHKPICCKNCDLCKSKEIIEIKRKSKSFTWREKI